MVHVTVPNEVPRKQLTVGGTPSTGPFSFDFTYFDAADIDVYLGDNDTPEDPADYTLTGSVGTDDGFEGGDIDLDTAVSNTTVTIVLDINPDRVTDFPTTGPFDIDALNLSLDRFTALFIQLLDQKDRSVRLAETDADGATQVLPALADRLSKFFKWDASGNPVAFDINTIGALGIPVDFADGGTGGSYATAAALLAGLDLRTLTDQDALIGSTYEGYDSANAKTDVEQAWTAAQYFSPQTDAAPGATPTANFATGSVIHWTTSANITGITISGTANGGHYDLMIEQGASHTLDGTTFDAAITWIDGDTVPDTSMPTTAGSILHVHLVQVDGSLYGSYVVYGAV